ncbi:MAG: putative terminase large subunit [Prokaryotic dsDNA virus sp.]|nr:MAG: putative terminase large subunit [Prokaryotic dsDNA virus sp.]|tara:strand:+ start:8679 stop:9830 length:1152 start_codon:yes stop_codon:yes gene_type:complete
MKIKTNVVFEHLSKSNAKIIVEQGGTRSGKTYNILLWLLLNYCSQNNNKTITVVRKTFPAVRGTVMRDFFEILKNNNIYYEELHLKTTHEYFINTNRIEFISLDQPTKIRGRKRDVLFINECNELNFEDWQQLIFRTTEKIIIDYNPSDEFHWIYDKVLTRDDVEFFKTTYKDNPFLEDVVVKEIERLQNIDDNYWRVYGLGERGQNRSLIFNFNTIKEIPPTAKLISKGLDFGYTNDPTALVETYTEGDNMYINELLYRTGMTNQDIAREFSKLNLDRRDEIWADSAEPKSIEEIYRLGFNIKPTAKGSVNIGIDIIRRYKLYVTERSINLIKELRNYKYIEDKNGQLTNKPIDAFNHATDAARYSVVNRLSRPNYGKYAIR